MMVKRGLGGCDAQTLKAVTKINGASHSAPAFQSQTRYLTRRFGVSPARAAVIAFLCFGEAQ